MYELLFDDLFRESTWINSYRGQWEPMGSELLGGGSVMTVRATVLKDRTQRKEIAIAALKKLFDDRLDVPALGGKRAPSVLDALLEQFASESSDRIVAIMPVPVSLQTMQCEKPGQESRVRTRLLEAVPTDRPRIEMFDAEALDERLVLPRWNGCAKNRLLRFGHYDMGRARPFWLMTGEVATRDGSPCFSARTSFFTFATREDVNRIRRGDGKLYVPNVPKTLLADGATCTLAMPTLMVFQLRPRGGGRYDNMRMGLNFGPGGEELIAVSNKVGDFDEFLRFFRPEFGPALRRTLYEKGTTP